MKNSTRTSGNRSLFLKKIGKYLLFLVFLVFTQLFSQFIINVTNHYKITTFNFVEEFDNLENSVKKAIIETAYFNHQAISSLPNCLLFFIYLVLGQNIFSALFFSISFSLDGYFYLQTLSSEGALSVSLLIISCFFSISLVLMHNLGRSFQRQIYLALFSLATSFCSFKLHQHILPISLSVFSIFYALFIIYPFRILETKLLSISQFFAKLLCLSASILASYICSSLSIGFKLYPVSISDLYSMIYKEPLESYHARCKTSNNVITSFLFWFSIYNHSNPRWKSLSLVLICGLLTIFMESTLFDFRSLNDPKNANYYDFRILCYFVSSLIISTMDNMVLSSLMSFSLLVFSFLWRFDCHSLFEPCFHLFHLYFPLSV